MQQLIFYHDSLLFLTAVFVIMSAFLLAGCTDENNITDYSKSEHWASLPITAEKDVDIASRIFLSIKKQDQIVGGIHERNPRNLFPYDCNLCD
ncbi:MAG: hypothetical protein JJE17_12695 [Peptostreptococcaceae bacterium]|nr:hypothetical protein [Peptostreptococcaceae bacterium]